MADRNDRNPKNAPGRFYTDSSCRDCDSCRRTAPGIFEHDVAGGYSYVKRQPVTPGEVAAAMQARKLCATEAIGDDGEGEAAPPARIPAAKEESRAEPRRGFFARLASALGLG